MAILTRVEPVVTGTDPGFVACAGGGDFVAVDKDTVVIFRNASGSPITVTLVSQVPDSPGVQAESIAVSVPATTGVRAIRVNPSGPFVDANGRAQFTYSGVTSLTVAAIRVA